MTPRPPSLGEAKARLLGVGQSGRLHSLTGAKLGSRSRVASQLRQPSVRCTDPHGTSAVSPTGRPNERDQSFSAGSGTTSVLRRPCRYVQPRCHLGPDSVASLGTRPIARSSLTRLRVRLLGDDCHRARLTAPRALRDRRPEVSLPAQSGEWKEPVLLLPVEPDRIHVAARKTRAIRDRDQYVISANRCWVTDAGIRDLYTVFAETDSIAGHQSCPHTRWRGRAHRRVT
jgi:hypothetical protein